MPRTSTIWPGRVTPSAPSGSPPCSNGATKAGLADALVAVEPVAATREDLERVHPARYLDRIEGISLLGGGRLDPDTYASAGSWNAAVLAAGAGLTAVRELQAGRGDSAFCAVRPPGHHATRNESMGFCFVNNVAVVAASLAAQGERVMVFDYDAHHGNGTHDIFYADPRVLFVSIHQWPLYPGTGRHDEVGEDEGRGITMNIPVPPGATGDVYLHAFDQLVAPRVDAFAPTWVLISAGFDAHRADPITELGLAAGDYAPAHPSRAVAGACRSPAGDARGWLRPRRARRTARPPCCARWPTSRATPIEPTTSGGPGMVAVGAHARRSGNTRAAVIPRPVPAGPRRTRAAQRPLPRRRPPAVPGGRHACATCWRVTTRTTIDFDVTTDARPDDIKKALQGLGRRGVDPGREVRHDRRGKQGDGDRTYEITTHRAEAYHEDSRKPDVEFSDRVESDLSRRDFTINAMALELTTDTPTLVDPFGGAADLMTRTLRTPLAPEVSFSDDPLRMLRAARFIARFNATPVPELVDAVREMHGRLAIVSAERIRDELDKLITLPIRRPGCGSPSTPGWPTSSCPNCRRCASSRTPSTVTRTC